jgi:formate C-acetyltransferase
LAAPKYGRNEKEADQMGAELLGAFAEYISELNPKYPAITYLPGAGTFSWYIAIGEGLGASPDGRLSGEAVSSNMSPSAGAATRGITGAILSHAAFDMTDLPVGSPTDLRLSARQAEGEDGLNRLMGVVKGFVAMGGNMLTLTVADTDILRRAQLHPEQYRDLRVRMGGWSAYFTMLSKEQQDHHIAKQDEL